MRAKVAFILGLVALLVAVPLAGCGEEEGKRRSSRSRASRCTWRADLQRCDHPVPEPERRLGPGVPGWPAARASGQSYLAVFLLITNDSDDEAFQVADDFAVTDASGRVYASRWRAKAVRSSSAPSSRTGLFPSPTRPPPKGRSRAMLLFLVDDDVTEERPLELEIKSSEGTGIVELDI